jgi:DNA-binding GntR family transcriptional regulator
LLQVDRSTYSSASEAREKYVTPEVERHPPIYTQIVADIRRRIVDGELRPGDAVPSERQIAADWSVGRGTGTRVIAALRAVGLVETVQGVGTVVARDAVKRSAHDRLVHARRTGRIYTPGEYARITSAELVAAPGGVADALGVEPGALVVRRHRVTFAPDDRPVSASTSWFDGALAESAPLLLSTERIKEGTALYVERATGRKQSFGRDFHRGRLATAEDVSELGVEPGSVVDAGVNYVYDEEGAVLEFGEYAHPPGCGTGYEYDLR